MYLIVLLATTTTTFDVIVLIPTYFIISYAPSWSFNFQINWNSKCILFHKVSLKDDLFHLLPIRETLSTDKKKH